MHSAPAPYRKKMVARGHYDYFLDGVLQPIVEDWKLYEATDSFWLESERRVPTAGLTLKVCAELREGQIVRSFISWCQGGQRVASVLFKQGPDSHDYLHRVVGAGSRRHSCRGPNFFPLLRVFTGTVFSGVPACIDQANTDASTAVDVDLLIPWIKDPAQAARLLSPSVSRRRVRWCGAPLPMRPDKLTSSSLPLPLPLPSSQALRCYAYFGDQYGEDTRFWLSEGLLQAYTWQQAGQSTVGNWHVALAGMSGTWPGEMFVR